MAEPRALRVAHPVQVTVLAVLAVLVAACNPSPGGRAAPSATGPAITVPATSGPTTTTARRFEIGTVEDVRDGDRSYRYHAAVLDTRILDDSGRPAPTDFDRFICGGSLVDARHVLTAGHCVIDSRRGELLPAADLRVVVGRALLRSGGGARRAVEAIRVHPRYGKGDRVVTHDVALLTLSEPVTGIAPVALVGPGDDLTSSGQQVTLTGWGDATSRSPGQVDKARLRNRLKAVHTALVATIVCPYEFDQENEEGAWLVLCLRTGERVGFCRGDSGGPVVAWVGNRPVQVGVVSAAAGCSHPRYPGIAGNLGNGSISAFVRAAQRGSG